MRVELLTSLLEPLGGSPEEGVIFIPAAIVGVVLSVSDTGVVVLWERAWVTKGKHAALLRYPWQVDAKKLRCHSIEDVRPEQAKRDHEEAEEAKREFTGA